MADRGYADLPLPTSPLLYFYVVWDVFFSTWILFVFAIEKKKKKKVNFLCATINQLSISEMTSKQHMKRVSLGNNNDIL